MTPAVVTCPHPDDEGGRFRRPWRRALARRWPGWWPGRAGDAAPAAALPPRLRDDIGLDPTVPGADGRHGRDFTRYLQYL
ncbi:hypothetical protein [Phreatobacter sp. AB_2022a]|uniref:hypothetical protein n=1 Tax=Phreatobacter sp. AB_2022a TaxID=3003134 RepID=UPI00228764CF|nr:hypothetical protein [Phreatobacter sp. AB_2022a]MCZ0734242.1 hypothetical protein [Phreatobacter sp. AB_2022a]